MLLAGELDLCGWEEEEAGGREREFIRSRHLSERLSLERLPIP